jgi:putative hydrolase of the HAD superfamily
LLLTGVTMGGGPSSWATRDHAQAGHAVYATPDAARSFNDDLDVVTAEMGIELVSEDEALALRRDYFARYGTTLEGLLTEREVDAGDYLAFVHDVPVEAYLEPDPALGAMLNAIPLRRIIYTNGTVEYARRVLRALDLADCFERIIGIEQVGLRSKLYREAYERALALLEAQGDECIMIEDSARNLPPAKELGLTTVLVQTNSMPRGLAHDHAQAKASAVDFVVKDVLSVGNIVQDLLGKT